ncbi:autotransporter outer membrane beta-barrel domain-containing protein [Bordetella hinzii]|uniref:autotransporter outer membrane beta-barrel domain-containing protein n=1 Tax=Bordetella hinzii TaxID=103855 RepID=UPI0013EFC61A|nr:autotransporter outer membrane beta-barrel domain-containing protein [Bordetella hinzii]QII85076.1 autotransporter outer membrane beta-barrel domain-containing protein [Bordetella hinzii]
MRTISQVTALTWFCLVSVFFCFPAHANCTSTTVAGAVTTTCDTTSPNPYTGTIGSTSAPENNYTLILDSGAQIDRNNGGRGPVYLGNDATITLQSGASITNFQSANTSLDGGPNAITVNNNSLITVEEGASIISRGPNTTPFGETINYFGAGNTLINRGLIQNQSGAAIYFEGLSAGPKNVIDNYGTIETLRNGSVIGSGGIDPGIIIRNQTGGRIVGNLNFGSGSDELTLYTGSTITGSITGGGGTNTLTLAGDGGTSDTFSSNISGFGTLTKTGDSTWTLGTRLSSFSSTTVSQGTLVLGSADRVYSGTLQVDAGGTLRGTANTMPISSASGINTSNVVNNGAVVFDQATNGTYTGQIVGSGSVEKTGTGVLTLSPNNSSGNTYTGGTTITEGTIAIGADNALGDANGALDLNGGTLRFNDSFDLAATRAISTNAPDVTLDTQGFSTTIAQDISGNGGLTKIGTGTLTLEGNNSYRGGTTLSEGTLAIAADSALGNPNGALTLNGGTLRFNDSFDLAATRAISTNALGSTIDTQGFDTTVSQGIAGGGGIDKTGAGTLTLNGANTFVGPLQVQQGVVLLGDADHAAASLAGNASIAAGATLGGYGTVAQSVTNNGTLAVAGALATASASTTGTLTITGDLNNNGLLKLDGARPGNQLVTRNYVGNNGQISLSTALAADNSPTDLLTVRGGTATGTSALTVVNAGGLGAVTQANGIRIVQASDGATTAAAAFRLAGPVVAGPYEYSLYRGGQGDSESWFLRSTIDCSNPSAPRSLCESPSPGIQSPPPPDYRRETSLYSALGSSALLFGRSLMDSLAERTGTPPPDSTSPFQGNGRPWARVLGAVGKREGADNGIYGDSARYSYDITGIQAGIDLLRTESRDGQRNYAGVMGAIGYIKTDVDHYTGQSAGTNRTNAYSLGAYWTHFGPGNWYFDGSLSGNLYRMRANSGRGISELKTKGKGVSTSLEAGYTVQLDEKWRLTPFLQTSYQWIDIDSASDSGGKVRFSDVQSLTAKTGVRLSHTWNGSPNDPNAITASMRLALGHEFLGKTKTEFQANDGYVPFRSDLSGTWGEAKAAIIGNVSKKVSLYATAGYERALNGDGHQWDGKIGVRISW